MNMVCPLMIFHSKTLLQLNIDGRNASCVVFLLADLPCLLSLLLSFVFSSLFIRRTTAAVGSGAKKDAKPTIKSEDRKQLLLPSLTSSSSNGLIPDELQYELNRLNASMNEMPTKIISKKQMIQFTCDFKIFNLNGKITFKSLKDFIHHINPIRLCCLSGNLNDFQVFTDSFKSTTTSLPNNNNKIELLIPLNFQTCEFEVFTESLKLQISRQLIPSQMKVIRTTNENQDLSSSSSSSASSSTGGQCTVALLKGIISTNEMVTPDGIRVVKYLGEKASAGPTTGAQAVIAKVESVKVEETDETKPEVEELMEIEEQEEEPDSLPVIPILKPGQVKEEEEEVEELIPPPIDETIGVISFGEVTLIQMKQQLDAIGIKTDFRVGSLGGILVCNDQVIISKDQFNHFHLEGPPIKAYFEARKILYQQFAFV
jgi:hypothetical protein